VSSAFSLCRRAKCDCEPRKKSEDDFLPALNSVMSRAARAFMSGPAAKLMRSLRPNFFWNAPSISFMPLRPPKVCEPATKISSSPSFFAAAVTCSKLSAAMETCCAAKKAAPSVSATSAVLYGGMGQLRSFELIFAGHQTKVVFLRIANNADGVLTAPHRVDRLLQHAAQQNDALVGDAEMLGRPIEDRPLALLRAAVLVAARDPAGLLVPAVFSRHAVEQSLLALVGRHAARRLAVDKRPEVEREVHRAGIVDRDAPAERLVAFVGRGERRRVILRQVIADLVHVRHEKEADGAVIVVADAAGKRVENSPLLRLGSELLVAPETRLGRTMEPFEMVLIDAVLDHLQEVAVDDARVERAHAVLSDEDIVARQQRRGIGAEIREDDAGKLLHLVCGLADAAFVAAVGRLPRLFEDFAFDVVKPAVIAAAEPAVLDVAERERGAAMRAAERQETRAAAIVAEQHEVFAQQPPLERPVLQFARQGDRLPVASQHLAARRSAADARESLVLFEAQRHCSFPFRRTVGELAYEENRCQPDARGARQRSENSRKKLSLGEGGSSAPKREGPVGWSEIKAFETDCSRFAVPECASARPAFRSSARRPRPAVYRWRRRRGGLPAWS